MQVAVVVIVVFTINDDVIGDTQNTFQSHAESFLDDLRAHLQAKRQSKPSILAKRCGKCSKITGFLI